MGVSFGSGGSMTAEFTGGVPAIGSVYPVMAASALPASSTVGQIVSITDFGFPYVQVQWTGSVWKQITHFYTTFASLPSAATFSGFVGIVSVCGGSSEWFSNGTDWYPVGGSVILSQADFTDPNNTLVGTLSTTSQTRAKIAGWSLVIPANLTKGINTCLEITLEAGRAQSINASWATVDVVAWDLSSSLLLSSVSFAANNTIARTIDRSRRISSTQMVLGRSGSGVNATWGTSTNHSTGQSLLTWDEATAQTLYATGMVTSTAGDIVYLKSVAVTLNKWPQ